MIPFYANFSKVFDKVPHKELRQKIGNIVVGGCLMHVLDLDSHQQNVRVDKPSSRLLSVQFPTEFHRAAPSSTGLLQLHKRSAGRLSGPFIFADNSKILSINTDTINLQRDLHFLEHWVRVIKMVLAMCKCAEIIFRGSKSTHTLMAEILKSG